MHIGIANPRWRGKLSRHSRCVRNTQFCVSGKRPMVMTQFFRNILDSAPGKVISIDLITVTWRVNTMTLYRGTRGSILSVIKFDMRLEIELVAFSSSSCASKIPLWLQSTNWYKDMVAYIAIKWAFNTLRPRQNGRHFADDIFNAFSWMKT